MFIDTHSHLNFNQFDGDLEEVIDRACTVGVNQMIVVGSDINNSKKAIKMANENSHLFATIGIHPSEIDLHWEKRIKEIDNLCCHSALDAESINKIDSRLRHVTFRRIVRGLRENDIIVAIGEVGLDYHQKNRLIKKEVQLEALEAFIDLAKKKDLPIIFHCREAMNDFIAVLRRKKPEKGVLHCFPGNLEEAKKILGLGLLISFTGLITFKADFDEVIRKVPLERIMIETDCPFLAPEPYRGKRNEPAYVVEVARRIAEIKDIPYFKVAEETTRNAVELFELDKL